MTSSTAMTTSRSRRLAASVVLVGVATVALSAPSVATVGQYKQPVCHPKSGGWVLISPDKASSHIDEAAYPNGHYWKHEHDGRHDVYAANGACPPVAPPVTVTPTTTATVTGPPVTITVTAPPVTSTETQPPVTTTETLPPVTITETVPGPTSTTTSTGPATTVTETVPGPTSTSVLTGPPSTVTNTIAGPTETQVIRSAGKELAYTGSDFRSPLTWVLLLVLAGITAYSIRFGLRRNGAHR